MGSPMARAIGFIGRVIGAMIGRSDIAISRLACLCATAKYVAHRMAWLSRKHHVLTDRYGTLEVVAAEKAKAMIERCLSGEWTQNAKFTTRHMLFLSAYKIVVHYVLC